MSLRPPTPTVVDDPADLTPEWVQAALAHGGVEAELADVRAERIGTGQIGASYRLHLDHAGGPSAEAPASLVAKLATGDPAARQLVSGGFAKEVGFYAELAATVAIRRPRCWYAAIADDDLSFTLLLEDLAEHRPGVQADGCPTDRALAAVANLAGLHAPRWNDPSLLEHGFLTPADEGSAAFLGELLVSATEGFVDRYAAGLDDRDPETLRAAARVTAAWQVARPAPFSLVHGDYRLDNLMFPVHGDDVVALDWQTVTLGPPLRDLAYFLGTSLDTTARRADEEHLVGEYHRALVGRGIAGYGLDRCWDDYRFGQLQGPMITVLGAMYATAERSASADAMFLAMARRSCAAIRDLGSIELV